MVLLLVTAQTIRLYLRPQSLKLEALQFLRLSMDKHPPFVFHTSIKETIDHVTACVKEDWYKVTMPSMLLETWARWCSMFQL